MRRTILVTPALVLAAAAPAGAQAPTTVTATPNAAGKAAGLRFQLDATQPPVNGAVPDKLALQAAGFRYDPRAVKGRCSQQSAVLNECPANSKIGSGNLVLHVSIEGGLERDATPTLKVYLAKGSNTKILAVAFVAGYRVVPGSIDPNGGVTVHFDKLPAPPAFQGVSYALRSVRLDVGASRVVKKYRTSVVRTKSGKKRRIRKVVGRTRYDLIHNPAACAGVWSSSIGLGFPDLSQMTVPTQTPCTS